VPIDPLKVCSCLRLSCGVETEEISTTSMPELALTVPKSGASKCTDTLIMKELPTPPWRGGMPEEGFRAHFSAPRHNPTADGHRALAACQAAAADRVRGRIKNRAEVGLETAVLTCALVTCQPAGRRAGPGRSAQRRARPPRRRRRCRRRQTRCASIAAHSQRSFCDFNLGRPSNAPPVLLGLKGCVRSRFSGLSSFKGDSG